MALCPGLSISLGRAWWIAVWGGGSLVAGLQASLLAALATAVGALPVFVVQRLTKRQESAFLAFPAGVMLAATVLALLLPSLEARKALVGDGGKGTLLTGLAEPLGALLGLAVLGSMPMIHAMGLALAAGAMLFVVSHEIIRETHRNGFESAASAMLLGGVHLHDLAQRSADPNEVARHAGLRCPAWA